MYLSILKDCASLIDSSDAGFTDDDHSEDIDRDEPNEYTIEENDIIDEESSGVLDCFKKTFKMKILKSLANLLCFKRLLKAEVTDTYDGVNNHGLFTSSYQPCWTGGSVTSPFTKLAKCFQKD